MTDRKNKPSLKRRNLNVFVGNNWFIQRIILITKQLSLKKKLQFIKLFSHLKNTPKLNKQGQKRIICRRVDGNVILTDNLHPHDVSTGNDTDKTDHRVYDNIMIE